MSFWKKRPSSVDILTLMNKIVPPPKYLEREGFSNTKIIDGLDQKTKEIVENELINRLLLDDELDILVVKTLAYLRSEKSLKKLETILDKEISAFDKLVVANAIYEISQNRQMIDVALSSVNRITDKYTLIAAFYYLSRFNVEKAKSTLTNYVDNNDYLISYNAKRYLDMMD